MPCRWPRAFRTLVHITKTNWAKELSMTRQPSSNPQHRVLRGQAVMPISGRSAGLEGKWSHLGRRRD
jgi:hypothetical protein